MITDVEKYRNTDYEKRLDAIEKRMDELIEAINNLIRANNMQAYSIPMKTV